MVTKVLNTQFEEAAPRHGQLSAKSLVASSEILHNLDFDSSSYEITFDDDFNQPEDVQSARKNDVHRHEKKVINGRFQCDQNGCHPVIESNELSGSL